MPVTVTRSYLGESTCRYGSTSYSPSSSTSHYRTTPLSTSTYRSSYCTPSSYRATSGLDDSFSSISGREKSESTRSSYCTPSSYRATAGLDDSFGSISGRDKNEPTRSKEYSKSRSVSSASSVSGASGRRASSYSAPMDISRYLPANYVAGSSRLASARPLPLLPLGSPSRYSRSTQEPERETCSPIKSKSSQDKKGLTGLNNIGNTCFLNSIVQCLSNTKVLLEYIINQEYSDEIRSSAKSALMKRFAELIKNLWEGDKISIPTYSFKTEVDVFAPRFSGYYQQDAQEFLRYLLEGLHDELNRVAGTSSLSGRPLPDIADHLSDGQRAVETWKRYLRLDNSKIVDTFGGLLKSTLECTHCGHCSTTFEPFWDLSLPIPDGAGGDRLQLHHCLQLFTKEEYMDGDEMPTCSKCKTRRKCKKRILIQKFPEVLVIHLKRFSLGSRARKVDSAIDFPSSQLDMAAYSATGTGTGPHYDLYAVVNHSGTCHTGHYTAYCRHPYSHRWHLFNDRSVSSVTAETLSKRDAYVLFYEQTASTNL